MGQIIAGLATLTEAFSQQHSERADAAELLRLQGELLLAQDGRHHPATEARRIPLEAEACFQQALDTARSQQAKMLELRAAVSLSRLWQQQGKRQEARQLLAEVYAWFTEGFGTSRPPRSQNPAHRVGRLATSYHRATYCGLGY